MRTPTGNSSPGAYLDIQELRQIEPTAITRSQTATQDIVSVTPANSSDREKPEWISSIVDDFLVDEMHGSATSIGGHKRGSNTSGKGSYRVTSHPVQEKEEKGLDPSASRSDEDLRLRLDDELGLYVQVRILSYFQKQTKTVCITK